MPRITFGMIVLNGEPFVRYNLRALYPFAHQIIVVEGASPVAAQIATPNGHSIDGTTETLRRFKAEEDPEDKLMIVTAEDHGYPNGFWPGEKDEQSQAYACRATGDWLWQIDIDESYRQDDMRAICGFLQSEEPSMVFFYFRMFMYHHRLEAKGVDPEYCQSQPIPRLFKWREGYQYVTHRPPTVVNENGVNLKFINPALAEFTRRQGWYIWHYPYLFRQQFVYKSIYYEPYGFRADSRAWADAAVELKRPPFAVLWHGLSWLEPLNVNETPPESILQMAARHSDYDLPGYTRKPSCRCLAAMARIYLRSLRFFRVRVWGRRWFNKSYLFPYELRKPKHSVASCPSRRVKEWLKKTWLFRSAKHVGLVGRKPF